MSQPVKTAALLEEEDNDQKPNLNNTHSLENLRKAEDKKDKTQRPQNTQIPLSHIQKAPPKIQRVSSANQKRPVQSKSTLNLAQANPEPSNSEVMGSKNFSSNLTSKPVETHKKKASNSLNQDRTKHFEQPVAQSTNQIQYVPNKAGDGQLKYDIQVPGMANTAQD